MKGTCKFTDPCNDSILDACDLADGACLIIDLCKEMKQQPRVHVHVNTSRHRYYL